MFAGTVCAKLQRGLVLGLCVYVDVRSHCMRDMNFARSAVVLKGTDRSLLLQNWISNLRSQATIMPEFIARNVKREDIYFNR